MNAHWAVDYLGLPWHATERNCWLFFRDIQARHYGREIPILQVDAASLLSVLRTVDLELETGRWERVKEPGDGDAVLMGKGGHPYHVGCYVADLDRVIHCAEGAGVLLQPRRSLEINGWTDLRYYHASRDIPQSV